MIPLLLLKLHTLQLQTLSQHPLFQTRVHQKFRLPFRRHGDITEWRETTWIIFPPPTAKWPRLLLHCWFPSRVSLSADCQKKKSQTYTTCFWQVHWKWSNCARREKPVISGSPKKILPVWGWCHFLKTPGWAVLDVSLSGSQLQTADRCSYFLF